MPTNLEILAKLNEANASGSAEFAYLPGEFESSCEISKGMEGLQDVQRLQIYSLFKQATIGDVNVSQPSFFDFVGKEKWKAWNELKGTSNEVAKQAYVWLIKFFLQDGKITSTVDISKNSQFGFTPSVSTFQDKTG